MSSKSAYKKVKGKENIFQELLLEKQVQPSSINGRKSIYLSQVE